jgi:hypothetical protein
VQYGFQDASLVVLSERAISRSFIASQGEYGGASTIIEVRPLYGCIPAGLVPLIMPLLQSS